MVLVKLFLGIALLATGRRLFWLFLGGLGFFFGFDFAERAFHGQPHTTLLLIALLGGVMGALLAVFLQKLAIVAGGFVAGGYLLVGMLQEFGLGTGHYPWLLFLAGGIIGAVLMSVLFGWTLIILSSAIGSLLILQALHPGPHLTRPLFVVLLASGIVIQYGLVGRKSLPRRKDQ